MSDQWLYKLVSEKMGVKPDGIILPPPCTVTLQGELVEYNKENHTMKHRFPVLEEYLNPYSTLQGGIVAAVIDNTIGPLSMLVAPPNVTREMRVKYSRPVTLDIEFLFVEAKLVEKNGKRLKFIAMVRDKNNKLYARADSSHVII